MKSQPVTQSTSQQTDIPAWLTSLSQQAGTMGANLPQYSPYTGAGPAGLTPQQLQAMGLSSSNVGQGQGYASSAYNPLSSLTGFQGNQINASSLLPQIQGLLNPATQDVIDATNRQIDRNTAGAQSGVDTSLAAQHAFGGSRQAVADAVTQSQGELQKNQLAAQLNQGNFQNALSAALSGAQSNQTAAANAANTRLGAANALSGLGQTIGGLNSGDLSNLLTAGGVGQQSQTAQNLFNYQQYLNQFQIPDQQASTFASILASLPKSTTQTGTSSQMSYSNPLMGLAGLGLGLGSLGTGGGATLGGSALSGLGGSLSGMGGSLMALLSDRRAKDDISRIGRMADGTPVYRFRYKGDPAWQVGLMADEVDPAAVHTHPSGLKMVDYGRATLRAARIEGLLS